MFRFAQHDRHGIERMEQIEKGYTDAKLRHNKMKRLLRIFELSKNEQRVVLIVILVLVVIALIRYERRVHDVHVRAIAVPEAKISPSPAQISDER